MQDAVTPPTILGMFVRPNRRLAGAMRSGGEEGENSGAAVRPAGAEPRGAARGGAHSEQGRARLGEGQGGGQAEVPEPDAPDGGAPPLQPLLELLRHLPPGRAQWSRPSASRMARDVASISTSVSSG